MGVKPPGSHKRVVGPDGQPWEPHQDRWISPGEKPPPPLPGTKAFGSRFETSSGDSTKRLQTFLPWDVFRRLKSFAGKQDVSISSVVAVAISEYLDRKELGR